MAGISWPVSNDDHVGDDEDDDDDDEDDDDDDLYIIGAVSLYLCNEKVTSSLISTAKRCS